MRYRVALIACAAMAGCASRAAEATTKSADVERVEIAGNNVHLWVTWVMSEGTVKTPAVEFRLGDGIAPMRPACTRSVKIDPAHVGQSSLTPPTFHAEIAFNTDTPCPHAQPGNYLKMELTIGGAQSEHYIIPTALGGDGALHASRGSEEETRLAGGYVAPRP